MLFRTPALSDADGRVHDLILGQRRQLRHQVNQNPNRWTVFLRRNTFARAVQGSNSIEGYNASVDEASAIIDDDRPEDVAEETVRALIGYRNALTYVLQVHDDPHFDLNAQFIKSLHFMMIGHDLLKLPGQWRPGAVLVVHGPSGETVYEGPDAELVPGLMDELVGDINRDDSTPPTVRAAMAHLNLAMIHPFRDGNGRMARALQTLVMAREGILSPMFCSIEEWLGRNTGAYYAVLAQVGRGAWHPENDAAPWIKFCLRAHYQQAATLIKRNQEIGRVWEEIAKLIDLNSLDDRVETALINAAFGFRVRNHLYRADHGISNVVASRDLRKLCDLELLVPVGEKRGRYYVVGAGLKAIRDRTRDTRRSADPYALVEAAAEPGLPGIG